MENQFYTDVRRIEDITDFLNATDDLIASKFILAEKRISSLLRTISENDKLYALFGEALSGYNYTSEFNRSKTSEHGRVKLTLPKNQARKIAYVFCLLMQIDTGKLSLKDFLDQYYFHPQPNQAFAYFAQHMLVPFKEITGYLYLNGITTLLDDEEIDYSLRSEAEKIIHSACSLINQSTVIGADTKRDLLVILSALNNSITPNKADILNALLIGYDYAIASTDLYDKLRESANQLKILLSRADII